MTAPSAPVPVQCATCRWWFRLHLGDYGRCHWHRHYPLQPVTAATDACKAWEPRSRDATPAVRPDGPDGGGQPTAARVPEPVA